MPRIHTERHQHALQDLNLKDDYGLPKGFFVDQRTGERLEELCREMANSCGMIEATLQLSLESEGERRATFINSALLLSARSTRSLKLFLSEWSVITEKSEEAASRMLGTRVGRD